MSPPEAERNKRSWHTASVPSNNTWHIWVTCTQFHILRLDEYRSSLFNNGASDEFYTYLHIAKQRTWNSRRSTITTYLGRFQGNIIYARRQSIWAEYYWRNADRRRQVLCWLGGGNCNFVHHDQRLFFSSSWTVELIFCGLQSPLFINTIIPVIIFYPQKWNFTGYGIRARETLRYLNQCCLAPLRDRLHIRWLTPQPQAHESEYLLRITRWTSRWLKSNSL